MHKAKVLLVGACGLFGRAFRSLFAQSYDIVQVTRANYTKTLERMKADSSIFFESVILAAQSGDYKLPLMSSDLFDVNMKKLHELLSVLVNKTDQIIYFSSGSVYKQHQKPINENTPLDVDSQNPYGVSKICAELLLNTYRSVFKFVHCVRPFFMYGPNQNKRMLFQQLIQKIKTSAPIEIGQGGGLILTQFL